MLALFPVAIVAGIFAQVAVYAMVVPGAVFSLLAISWFQVWAFPCPRCSMSFFRRHPSSHWWPSDAQYRNAAVFNADGSERFRLSIPLPAPDGLWFEQMYYVQGELTAFAALSGGDRAYVIDERNGAILRSYETR
jgi:hypothetical protein